MVTVSVVLSTYNRPRWLRVALDNILQQSFADFEVIVIDDGGEQPVRPVVEEFGDDRLRLIEHGENRGLAAARNTGIEAAWGKFVAFQDDDDLWMTDRLERELDYFEKLGDDVGVLAAGSLVLPDNLKTPGLFFKRAEEEINDFLQLKNMVWPDHGLIRKKCFESGIRLDEDLPARVDTELWMRMAREYNFSWLAEPLSVYYRHGANMCRNSKNHLQATKMIYEKHSEQIEKKFSRMFEPRVELINKWSKDRRLLIAGSGAAGDRVRRYLKNEEIEVDGFLDTRLHFDEKEHKSGLPIVGLQKLLNAGSKSRPFVLVESFYSNQIAANLEKIGYRRQADYEVNCIAILLENKIDDWD